MDYKKTFIELAIKKNALQFGNFKLKSERISPYFFNSGVFSDGESLSIISNLFIELIKEKKIKFTNVFGPAYKGISLASALSAFLASNHKEETYFIYDRKDQKLHGEKGDIVGTFQDGNTIIIDDVITAGTAMKNTLIKLEKFNLNVNSLVVLLDRQEKGSSSLSARDQLEDVYDISVISIINLDTLISFVNTSPEYEQYLAELQNYRELWGA